MARNDLSREARTREGIVTGRIIGEVLGRLHGAESDPFWEECQEREPAFVEAVYENARRARGSIAALVVAGLEEDPIEMVRQLHHATLNETLRAAALGAALMAEAHRAQHIEELSRTIQAPESDAA